jgi:hypothetical protein
LCQDLLKRERIVGERGKSGLLGGRAWRFELYPLVTKDLKSFDLDRALHVEVKLNDLLDLFFLSILGKSTFSTSA